MSLLKRNINIKGSAFPPKCNQSFVKLLLSSNADNDTTIKTLEKKIPVNIASRIGITQKFSILKFLDEFAFPVFFMLLSTYFLIIITKPIFSTSYFTFNYCLVYNKKIIIHSLFETVFWTILLFFAIYFFIFFAMQKKIFKKPFSWFLIFSTISGFLLVVCVDLVPELACCVPLTENLQIIKIPTFEQFNNWAKLLFHEIPRVDSFDFYGKNTQDFYSKIFKIEPDFENGLWQFDNIENIKYWPIKYSEMLDELDSDLQHKINEEYFYKKLFFVMLFAAGSFRFLWWSLLNH